MLEKRTLKEEVKKFDKLKKYIGLPLIFIFFALLITGLFLLYGSKDIINCGDGTLNDECSLRKPNFCLDGILIEKASICGCSELSMQDNDSCISKYQTNPKNISLKYILRGKEEKINFTVYKGMVNHVSRLPKFINYGEGVKPSRKDFKLRNINEKEQRELLLHLLTKIQNIAKNKEDQVRIAVSIVQNIPYESGIIRFESNQQLLNYSKYPYEILYDMRGFCGTRSELLAFLLKEMGYSVVLFYYPLENHESVGIKCPIKYSLDDTGYCFIETTGPSIISNYKNYYTVVGKLFSKPEVIPISEGDSLSYNLYEYKDAKDLAVINEIIEKGKEINIIKHNKLEKLREKYGLGFLYG